MQVLNQYCKCPLFPSFLLWCSWLVVLWYSCSSSRRLVGLLGRMTRRRKGKKHSQLSLT